MLHVSEPQRRHHRGGSGPLPAPGSDLIFGAPRGVEATEEARLPATDDEKWLPADEPLTEWATLCAAGTPMQEGTPGVLAKSESRDSSRAATRLARSACSSGPSSLRVCVVAMSSRTNALAWTRAVS